MLALRLAPLALLAGCAAQSPPMALPPAPSASASAEASPPAPAPRHLVSARLVGHDGKPMKLAHAHLGDRSFAADESGAVTLESQRSGFFVVRLTGVDHAEEKVGVYLDGGEVRFEARLGTYPRAHEKLEGVAVELLARPAGGGAPKHASWGRFRAGPGGALVAVVTAREDEILYRVVNLARDRNVNGPMADSYEHDGGGDYVSRIRATPGSKVEIRIDPGALPPPGRPAEVVFADPESRSARLSALRRATQQHLAQIAPDDRARRAEIARALAAEKDTEVAAALRLAYLVPASTLDRESREAKSIASEVLANLPPTAPMWPFWPSAALAAVGLAAPQPDGEAFLDALDKALGDTDAGADLLAARIRAASREGKDDLLARLHPLFGQRFPGSTQKSSLALYAPSRKVRPGRTLPDLDLPALPDGKRTPPKTRVTRASLRGRVTLLDFWGTWCNPCIAEMKTLHDTHARFKDRGFAVVSLSSNDPVDSIKNFRARRYPMPWTHVVLRDNDQDDVLARFEVKTYPSPILVDGDGVILAVGEELRGEALPRTVAAALQKR